MAEEKPAAAVIEEDSSDEEKPALSELPELQIQSIAAFEEMEVMQFLLNACLRNSRIANTTIIFSLPSFAVILGVFAVLVHWSGAWRRGDIGLGLMLLCSAVSAALLATELAVYPVFKREANEMRDRLYRQRPLKQHFHGANMMMVARYGTQLAGVVALEAGPHGRAEIVDWYVLNSLQNRGLGSDLLQIAIEFAKDAELHQLSISTWSMQQRAELTLRKHGFALERKGPVKVPWYLHVFGVYGSRVWTLNLDH